MKAKKHLRIPLWWPDLPGNWRVWLPSRGNVLFTLLVVAGLLWATNAGALPLHIPAAAGTSTGTVAYQGRLADSDGNPITETVNMEFRLYDVAEGGAPLWSELWTGANAVRVSDGLFNVMLGSLQAIDQNVIAGHDQLWLGITVGTDDEMTPRVQLGSVPFAVQALTVPDGSIVTAKIADGAVTTAKLNLSEGVVNIGTADSGAKLNISGPWASYPGNAALVVGAHGTSNFADHVKIQGDFASSTAKYGISLGGDGHHRGGLYAQNVGGPNNARGQITLWARSGGNIILDAGKVGIGTTDPGAKLDVNGDFRATGTKSAIVQTSGFGQRKLYAAESPEVRFFDEGLARLRDGVARVTLDPVFLETIEGDYLVHVTPYGDASLYVAEIGKDYFVVKERDGGPNVAFAWRLSAYRKGYAGVRLEQVKELSPKK